MILTMSYITMIIFAIIALRTPNVRHAVIYLSVFSLVCSLVYLVLGAPDVAIAEASIGCTLATILYLVAIKKYRAFTVYYVKEFKDQTEEETLKIEREHILEHLEDYTRKKELQLDFIPTTATLNDLKETPNYDLILIHTTQQLKLYGEKQNYHYMETVEILKTLSTQTTLCYIDEEDCTQEIIE